MSLNNSCYCLYSKMFFSTMSLSEIKQEELYGPFWYLHFCMLSTDIPVKIAVLLTAISCLHAIMTMQYMYFYPLLSLLQNSLFYLQRPMLKVARCLGSLAILPYNSHALVKYGSKQIHFKSKQENTLCNSYDYSGTLPCPLIN